MDRAEKERMVKHLGDVFERSGVVVLAHYSGLSVEDMTVLRQRLRASGANMKVVKNRLARLALKGKAGEGASELFRGPVAIAFSEDPVSAPKGIVDFARENEQLVPLGGFMGADVLDEKGINTLASLPSLDELRGKLVGLLQAPASKLARVTQAPAGQVARVVKAYAEKNDA